MCAQRRLRLICEDSVQPGHLPSLIIVFAVRNEEALGPWLSLECTTKTLIRLSGCPGWFESSLGSRWFVGFVVLWLIRYLWACPSSVLGVYVAFSNIWAAPSEFGTYRLCEQRRFRRACASAQSRQNLRCSLIQAVNQEEPWDRKPDPWPLWMAGHAQLKFVMTECSKTQIRLAGLISYHSVFLM